VRDATCPLCTGGGNRGPHKLPAARRARGRRDRRGNDAHAALARVVDALPRRRRARARVCVSAALRQARLHGHPARSLPGRRAGRGLRAPRAVGGLEPEDLRGVARGGSGGRGLQAGFRAAVPFRALRSAARARRGRALGTLVRVKDPQWDVVCGEVGDFPERVPPGLAGPPTGELFGERSNCSGIVGRGTVSSMAERERRCPAGQANRVSTAGFAQNRVVRAGFHGRLGTMLFEDEALTSIAHPSHPEMRQGSQPLAHTELVCHDSQC